MIVGDVLTATVSIALLFLLFYGIAKVWDWYKLYTSTNPMSEKNKKEEQKFMEELLEDIRKNPDDWFIVSQGSIGGSDVIANDKKNIGIVYSSGGTATILLNLDSLSAFDKFYEDTVKIQVSGDHVGKFISSAEIIIDKRGKELSFFRDELEKRL